jgi:hypothetical protein
MIESLAVVEEGCGEPFVIFGAVPFPVNEELVSTSARLGIDNTSNFVFLKAIWCKDWAGSGMHPGGK